ncbi:MAG: UDP-N-acetylmuramate dehydrogenase [Prevotella sp.]|jgi:UDP-N-acetylmuramate dehydrogenase|nr:UDP-N-acetylmuramate dehydrogenase [Prevotella sp.]
MCQENVQLKPYNAFQTEAYAKLFCEPASIRELKDCIDAHREEKKLIIGGGCNMFFTQDFDGLVIKPNLKGLHEISGEDDDDVFIEAMASEDWDGFVAHCVERGFSGVENLSLIPGTVGAAPVQNIGAYGAEVKDCIREVIVLDMEANEVLSFSNKECEFSYRDSIFKRTGKFIVLSVIFHLQKSYTYSPKYFDLNKELENLEAPDIQDVREAVIRIRRRKLPDHIELPNCGSFFKNPYISEEKSRQLLDGYPDLPVYPQKDGQIKTSAAFLIDRAGYRGKKEGNVGTYPNQALIIVNYGTADGNEILAFARKIQSAVKARFDIELEPEVWIF